LYFSPGLTVLSTQLKPIALAVTASLDEVIIENGKVFPNPVNDILNIAFDQALDSVVIYNLLGQEVITKTINANETTIDVSQLPLGTYLVKINTGDTVKTLKVIKQ